MVPLMCLRLNILAPIKSIKFEARQEIKENFFVDS